MYPHLKYAHLFTAATLLVLAGSACFVDDGRTDGETGSSTAATTPDPVQTSGTTSGASGTATSDSTTTADTTANPTSTSDTTGPTTTDDPTTGVPTTTDDPTTENPTTDDPSTDGPTTTDDPTTTTSDPTNSSDTGQSCNPPLEDCNGNQSDGCETNTKISPQHCGACNQPCDQGLCVEGECVAAHAVFVSSETFDGELMGLGGADEICTTLAQEAGFPGFFRAWLSTGQDGPFSSFVKDEQPYILPNGMYVAENWVDLTDGTIVNPIAVDEYGTEMTLDVGCEAPKAWTNTTFGGFPKGGLNCQLWTKSDGEAFVGQLNSTDGRWTESSCGTYSCAQSHHLYCFQQ